MDEIELLIFTKLVETDQLAHVVKGWPVSLSFPEIGYEIYMADGKITHIWHHGENVTSSVVTAA